MAKTILTKAEQIKVMSEASGISQADAEVAYEALFEAVKVSLKKDENVALGDIGRLRSSNRSARKARTGRNPRTGEPIEIAAKPGYRDIKINDSKSMREYMNS